jgi:hypothetical protein
MITVPNRVVSSGPWILTSAVSLLAVYVWGSSFSWQPRGLSAYQLFPVLGLLAFSIMWSHYLVGELDRVFRARIDRGNFFRNTGYVVLAAILLHPGILIYQRLRDGYGLPPGSYESYVAPGMAWLTILGSISLLAFLAYELHRFYASRAWWKYVVAAGDAAMLGIFLHGLRLGSLLQAGWYREVWLFYGLTLLIVVARKYVSLLFNRRSVAV